MDACTYESITGLKNYYGFKSLLKNGLWTQRYSCDDDTIVFNRIESFTFGAGGFVLRPNQVGVVLNLTCGNFGILPTQFIQESVASFDVDNQFILLNPQSLIKGIVITNSFSNVASATDHNLVLAIFDLY